MMHSARSWGATWRNAAAIAAAPAYSARIPATRYSKPNGVFDLPISDSFYCQAVGGARSEGVIADLPH
jgi:hypothetical protein